MRESRYALEQIAKAEAEGVRFRPADILRLNAIGLRIENPSGEGSPLHAGAVAWAGPVPFFEPTVASMEWYSNCACRWWSGGMLVKALAWACNRAREPGAFDAYQQPRAAWWAVWRFWRSIPARREEVVDALYRVIPGLAKPPPQKRPRRSRRPAPPADDAPLSYAGLVAEITAAAGQTIEYWRARTPAEISDVMRRWLRQRVAMAGGKVSELDRRDYDLANFEFEAAMQEIRERGLSDGR